MKKALITLAILVTIITAIAKAGSAFEDYAEKVHNRGGFAGCAYNTRR